MGVNNTLGTVFNATESTSNTTNTTNTDAHNIAVTDAAGDTYGSKLQITGDLGTYSTSDFGALQAAQAIALSGEQTARDSIYAGQSGLAMVADLFKLKGQDPLIQLVKPFGIMLVVVAVAWILFGGKQRGTK